MATSDNVLNIGFTSPSEIAESLPIVSRAVSAQPASASSIILSHSTFTKSANGNITAYSVPFEEFSIMRVSGSDRLKALSGPAIGIVTQGRGVRVEEQGKGGGGDGSGLDLDEGMVFFLGAGTDACFELPDGAEAWLAFYDGDKEARGQVGEQ
jgi:mannose-6-phosphate isomerase